MLTQNRCIIGIIIIIMVIFYYCKSKKTLLIKMTTSVIVLFVITVSFFRIENFFIKYNSIETAFNNSGVHGNIIKTIDTKNSTLIIYANNDASGTLLLYKDDNQWRVPVFNGNTKMKRLRDGSLLMLNKEKDTNNYYILISTDKQNFEITDSKNTIFDNYKLSNSNIFEELTENEYVAFIENVSKNYYIKIDDQIFYVLEEIKF